MQRYLFTCFIALLLAAATVGANAGVGLTELPGINGDGPVTVFYPSSAPDAAVRRGPFSLSMAVSGEPVRGNGRLVVISHGSGGNPWVHSNLARALVDAGFIVAMPEHQGDNASNPGSPGPASFKRRPAEVSRAIDAVARDARFARLLSLDKVGMYGMSAGGHTALSLAGGRWSPGVLKRHCEAHLDDDFHTCVGPSIRLNGDSLDSVKKAVALPIIRLRLDDDAWYTHDEPRIRAVVAGVPFSADFDFDSLARPRVPLGLVTAAQDAWLLPKFHSDRVAASCKSCERIADLPQGGHGALLSPPPPPEALSALLGELLASPPAFDRAVLPEVDRKIAAFFARHLLP